MSVSREALPTGSSGTQAVRALLLLPVKSLQTERGRRLVAALGLALALQGMVGMMFANPDAPSTARSSAGPAVAAGQAATGGATIGTTPAAARKPASPAKGAQATGYDTPEAAAIAWFADRARVPAAKVRTLQQVAAGKGKVKILVMAEQGDRIDTDEVTVARTKSGWRAR